MSDHSSTVERWCDNSKPSAGLDEIVEAIGLSKECYVANTSHVDPWMHHSTSEGKNTILSLSLIHNGIEEASNDSTRWDTSATPSSDYKLRTESLSYNDPLNTSSDRAYYSRQGRQKGPFGLAFKSGTSRVGHPDK
jgi:hypothetical protein